MNFIRSKIDNKLLHIVHCLDGDNPQERLDIAPEDQFLQLCLLRVNKGRSFRAHKHLWKPPETKSVIAQESWVVIKGSVKVSFYDKDDTLLTTEYSFLKADMFRPENEYFNHNISNYTTLSSYIEAPLSRGAKENRQISFDAFVSESAPYGSTLIRGLSSSLSGRSINPSHMIDLDNGTVRMGVGPSAHWLDPDPANVGVEHAEVSFSGTVSSPLSGDTYSHNSSYLLFNSALSAVQNDVIVSFDVAFYTNKNVNRRYAQINKHGSGWPGYF